MKIHVVSTCIPDRGERPCLPNVFATLAEAEAFIDKALRDEWETAALEDDDGELLPYPGDWQEANDQIAASYDDGSWGEWELSSHEIASPMEAALEAAEHWLAEEAASPHPGQTRPDEILRVIREALGKPHDAPDAASAAPQTSAPEVTMAALVQMRAAYGPLHDRLSPIIEGDVVWSEGERAALADMLETCCKADAAAERVLEGQPAPQTPDASALMLAALRLAAERIEMNNYGGEEDEHLAVIRAAIAAANGEA